MRLLTTNSPVIPRRGSRYAIHVRGSSFIGMPTTGTCLSTTRKKSTGNVTSVVSNCSQQLATRTTCLCMRKIRKNTLVNNVTIVLYSSQFKRHMESHSGGGQLTCPSRACAGKTFHNKDTLKHHMEVHKGEKKFCKYQECDKFFYAQHYLSDHIHRQHKDPYQCENVLTGCDFTTWSRRTLQNQETYYCPFKSGMSDEWSIVRNYGQCNTFSNFCIFSDGTDSMTVNVIGDIAITSYLLLYYQLVVWMFAQLQLVVQQ